MKIKFEIPIQKEREQIILQYFSLFAKTLMLGEDVTITDLEINDEDVIDSGICIY